jgi:hypothetical protein
MIGGAMSSLLLIMLLIASGPDEIRQGPWPPRGYACARAASSVEIDGRIDEAAWDAAPWTSDFVDIEGNRRALPRYRTRAKMLWDDQFFYVAAYMQEPHLWATLRKRDSVIYYDNDFEVFLDPDGDSHLYTEIELNALNTVWDLLLVKPYRDGGPAIHAWDIPGLKTAVHLEGTLNDPSDVDSGWFVEIAIPFAVIAETTRAACPPKPGDRWRVNFSRVQWQLDVVNGGYAKTHDAATGKPLPEDNWVWSPQREIAMHEPEHWGIVEFVTDTTVEVRPSPANRIEHALRWISYHLAAHREAFGRYPQQLPTLSKEAAVDGLNYRSDGDRYVLTGSDAGIIVTLDEQGRLLVALPE